MARTSDMTRMRVVSWEVRPMIMADDDENLEAVQVGPQVIPAARWQAFKDGGDAEALENVRRQVEDSQSDDVRDE
jgi:hypothetical protein